MRKILLLLGAPGVGKGTVGAALSRRWAIPLISSGDLLREAVKNGSPLGVEAKKHMDAGELVPDGIVVGMVRERTARPDCAAGYILDGFPRNLSQAGVLDGMLSGVPFSVVYLAADDEFLVARLGGRRICGACGAVYHAVNIPPRREGVCDACGGALVQRDDDKPEVIRRRLSVYHAQTAPLLAHYRGAGLLRELPGDGALDGTIDAVGRALGW